MKEKLLKNIMIGIIVILIILIIVGVALKCYLLINNKGKVNNENRLEDEISQEQNESNIISKENNINDENAKNELESENTESNTTINNETSEEKNETSNTDINITNNKNESTLNNSDSGNNNQKAEVPNSATQTPQTTPITSTKPTLTGTDTKKELTNTQTKYGVAIKTYTTTTYNVYSDGSRTVKSTSNSTEYDQSGYTATTAELKPEANTLKSSNASIINAILGYVNQYRKEANEKAVNGITNRKSLILDSNLTTAACARTIEMGYGNCYDHVRPNGTKCFTMLDEMGISYWSAAENIAYGYSNAKTVAEGWKNSPGHYANMISNRYSKIGIGVSQFKGLYYWAQMFTD